VLTLKAWKVPAAPSLQPIFSRYSFRAWLRRPLREFARPLAALACIAFLFGASAAARPMAPQIVNIERFFWLPVYGLILLWGLRAPGSMLAMMQQNQIVVAWGLLAVCSALWSIAPATSLYAGVQLLMTVLTGLALCAVWPRLSILRFVFFALLAAQIYSVFVVMTRPGWGLAPGGEWVGAFTHKNQFGSMMAMQIITAGALMLQGWRPLLTGAALIGALVLLGLSRAGTSMLALALMLPVLSVVLAYRTGRGTGHLVLALGCVAGAVLGLAVAGGFGVFDAVLAKLGKDTTLTGRTLLWNYGFDAFTSSPWIGHGYKAFWHTDQAAVFNLRHAIGHDVDFFHNNILEVAVAFGLLGPLLLLAGLGVAIARAIRCARAPGSASLWPLAVILFVSIYALAENPLFENHGFIQVLFVVALAGRHDPVERASSGAAQ
jgi:exopolysaccharide production protein ExoQ